MRPSDRLVQHRMRLGDQHPVAIILSLGPANELLAVMIAVAHAADPLDDQTVDVGQRRRDFGRPSQVGEKAAGRFANQGLGDFLVDHRLEECRPEVAGEGIPVGLGDVPLGAQIA